MYNNDATACFYDFQDFLKSETNKTEILKEYIETVNSIGKAGEIQAFLKLTRDAFPELFKKLA